MKNEILKDRFKIYIKRNKQKRGKNKINKGMQARTNYFIQYILSELYNTSYIIQVV
jgi:hypothetical protein